jgi:hypothetical protein
LTTRNRCAYRLARVDIFSSEIPKYTT